MASMGYAASVTITAYAHSLSPSCTLGPGQVEFEWLAVHPPLARDAALDALRRTMTSRRLLREPWSCN